MKRLIACICLFINALAISPQDRPRVIIFQHANVIDGVSREPLLDVSVTIANGKITGIQKSLKRMPAGAEVIDLKGKWLLPGYIDSHVHVDFEQAQRALRFGITTARTMGGGGFIDIEIRDGHRRGRSDIPEILAAGWGVRPDVFGPSFLKDFPELADMKPRVSGVENVRRLVRAFASKGVDHIKVLATERAGTPDTDPRKRTFSDEELIAIVDEARKAGLKVAAHAHGDEGAYAAVKAGVHSIEHGTWLSDKTLRLMKSRGTWLVSNIFADLDRPLGSIVSTNPILVERGRTMWPQAREVTRRAYEMGVHVVGATDLNYGREFDSGRWTIADNAAGLAKAGIPKMEAIKAITSQAAKLLEIDKRTGAIKKGLEADIVIVGDNPLSSIEALKDIRMIVNDGVVVFNKIDQ
ncbi:MAG TPA: amidohydrolase family protein [Pyrinomonadaceae bacterium]|nr:amidohydrolase family protein [Pyrinomonadaceae bacterium]